MSLGLRGLDPKQCALLVLGCQVEDFEDRADASHLTTRIGVAIDTVRRWGGEIIFLPLTVDILERQFIPSTNKEFFALARRNRFPRTAPAAGLHPDLGAQPDDLLMRRIRLGAFSTTGLDMHLTNCGVTTLIIAGMETSGSVLSTVREAADCDYRLMLLSDCIADRDRLAHRLLFERIFPRQAQITTVQELIPQLSSAANAYSRQLPEES